eukprot:772419-Amphidinium_carterae.2
MVRCSTCAAKKDKIPLPAPISITYTAQPMASPYPSPARKLSDVRCKEQGLLQCSTSVGDTSQIWLCAIK